MTILSKTIRKLRHTLNLFWANDPMHRRPLAFLASQEHRLRSKPLLHYWTVA